MIFIETFDGHCDSDLYSLKYHLLHHVVEGIQRFNILPVLKSNLDEQFNMPIKQSYRRTLQTRRT